MRYVNSNIRLLYGSRIPGRHKRLLRIQLSPQTFDWLLGEVEIGTRKYGSAFVELSTRTMLALITEGEQVNMVANEIKTALNTPYLKTNILRLLRYLVDDELVKMPEKEKKASAVVDEEKLDALGEAIFETLGFDNDTEWKDTIDDWKQNTE